VHLEHRPVGRVSVDTDVGEELVVAGVHMVVVVLHKVEEELREVSHMLVELLVVVLRKAGLEAQSVLRMAQQEIGRMEQLDNLVAGSVADTPGCNPVDQDSSAVAVGILTFPGA